MKLYFLTDESEKSLAPFFSAHVLQAVLASVVIVGSFMIIFWPRQPLAEFIATGSEPKIFFVVFTVTLIVNSYVNLCCGRGEMVQKNRHMIDYQDDKPTYEKEIGFYRYGMVEFLLHTFVLLLPLLPFLSLAAFNSAVSMTTCLMAASVLYSASLCCRMSGFLVYLCWGRSGTFGYFAARFLMIFLVFATLFFAPAINPLQLLYQLNQNPSPSECSFAIYMAAALSAILVLILKNNALVRRHMDKKSEPLG
jgi:hypothetical protein